MGRPGFVKVQAKPREPADLGSWALLYGLQWNSSPQQKTHRCEGRPAGRERSCRGGSNQAETRRGRWSDPAHRSRRRQQETEPNHRAGAEKPTTNGGATGAGSANNQRQNEGDNVNTGRTQARGTGREGLPADRQTGSISELRSTPTRRAGWTGRIVTTIGAIIALTGLAEPAGADELVSARKPSFRAEICANSWHPGRDFGTNPGDGGA